MPDSPAPSGSDAPTADAIEHAVLRAITPSPEMMERVRTATRLLVERAESAVRNRGSPVVRCLVAGSAARGTYLGDRLDIDLFLLFRTDVPREVLEREGLALGSEVLTDPVTKYAEHPYRHGTFEGIEVDAVPGYAVDDPSRPMSAVDRTPFHQEYLTQRQTPEMVAQVRLTKQFLRALGVYGSEARTGGFSGYLVELLVLRFGRLRELLAAARGWRIPVRLLSSPTAAPRTPDDVALLLDDPVDPNRNVATALTRRNLGRFILAAGHYLDHPSARAFDLPPRPALAPADAKRRLAERRTHVAILGMPRPDLVDDILYPQLAKAERALADEAERLGFQVVGTASAAGEGRVVVLLEVAQRELPGVKVQDGPPPGIDRVGQFLEKWTDPAAAVLQGPYVTADGRLAVETLRSTRGIEELLTEAFEHLALGRDLRHELGPASFFRSLEDTDPSPELSRGLADLLDKRLPWLPPRPR
ncbi:MAG: CCA tRNA nucleotidyltransferase [Thermoplasmata archaeon]